MESWKKRFTHKGKRYTVTFFKRPFREGIEAQFELEAESVKIAELGLGEKALIEKIKALINSRT